MIPTTSTLNAAAAAFERVVRTKVTMDITHAGHNPDATDITALVQSWSINRQITTDIPAAAKLVTGYVSAELTGTLIGSVVPDGAIVDGARKWSPYSASSILGGVGQGMTNPMRVRAGMNTTAGDELQPRFTGYLRELKVHGATRDADFVADDGYSQLRNDVALPVMGNSYLTSATSPRVGIRPNLSVNTIMDFALRQNNYYVSPPPTLNCILSVPAHGSLYAEPGYGALSVLSPCIEEPTSTGTETDDASMVSFAASGAFSGGPFGDNGLSGVSPSMVPICTGTSGTKKDIKALYDCNAPNTFVDAFGNGKTITVEAWVYCSTTYPQGYANTQPAWGVRFFQPGSVGTPTSYHLASVGVRVDGTPYICIGSGFTVGTGTTPVGTGWLYLRINLAFGPTTTTAKVHINNEAVQTITVSAVPVVGGNGTAGIFQVQLCTNRTAQTIQTSTGVIIPFEGLQVNLNAEGAPNNYAYVPNAYMDASLAPLVVSPHSDTDRDAKQLITDLTTAEYGQSYFDEMGSFYFFNRNRWTHAPGNTSQLTVVSNNALESLDVTQSEDGVFNQITVSYSPYGIKNQGMVYALSKLLGVHSGSTYVWIANLNASVVGLTPGIYYQTPVLLSPLPAGPVTTSGYRVSWWPDGKKPTGSGLTDPPTNVAVVMESIDDETVKFTVTNSESNPVYLVSGSDQAQSSRGNPFLFLFGRAIIINDPSGGDNTGQPTTYYVEDSTSIGAYGDQPLSLSDGDVWCQSLAVATTVGNDMLAQLKDIHPVLENISIKAHPGLQLGDRITLTDTDGTQFNAAAVITGFPDEGWDMQPGGSGRGYYQNIDCRLGV